MAVNAFTKGLMSVVLFLATGLALAETILISSQPGDGPLDVQGSASVQRQAGGVLIAFKSLTVTARFMSGEPLYITALRFNGSDVTGSGLTSLMFSERAPVGKWLAPGEVLPLSVPTPIFMRKPDWHQNDLRFDLHVEIRVEGHDGFIPVPTTLHELKLASDFSRRSRSDVHEIGGTSVTMLALSLCAAMVAYWGFVRWCKTPGIEAFAGLFLVMCVWIGGIYPIFRYSQSMLWVKAEALIVDSDVRYAPVGKGRGYRYAPIVKYQYEFGGNHFSSTQLQLIATDTFSSRDEAMAVLQLWENKRVEATPVAVWINPSDPSEAVLSRRLSSWSVFYSLLGMAGIFILWRRKKRE